MAIILRTRHFPSLFGPSVEAERTPELLRKKQAEYMALNPAAHSPTEMVEEKHAYVGNGVWRIHCRCGERTHTDPDWKVACCFGCGAIWTNITFPENWQEIEHLLVKRAVQSTRNWDTTETLDDLIAEQLQHGEAVL